MEKRRVIISALGDWKWMLVLIALGVLFPAAEGRSFLSGALMVYFALTLALVIAYSGSRMDAWIMGRETQSATGLLILLVGAVGTVLMLILTWGFVFLLLMVLYICAVFVGQPVIFVVITLKVDR